MKATILVLSLLLSNSTAQVRVNSAGVGSAVFSSQKWIDCFYTAFKYCASNNYGKTVKTGVAVQFIDLRVFKIDVENRTKQLCCEVYNVTRCIEQMCPKLTKLTELGDRGQYDPFKLANIENFLSTSLEGKFCRQLQPMSVTCGMNGTVGVGVELLDRKRVRTSTAVWIAAGCMFTVIVILFFTGYCWLWR